MSYWYTTKEMYIKGNIDNIMEGIGQIQGFKDDFKVISNKYSEEVREIREMDKSEVITEEVIKDIGDRFIEDITEIVLKYKIRE